MLDDVAWTWRQRCAPDHPASASPAAVGAALRERWEQQEGVTPGLGRGAEGDAGFEMLEPLLAVRGAILHALGQHGQRADHLLGVVRAARKAGSLTHASAALHDHKLAVSEAKAGAPTHSTAALMLRAVDARREEAKLLWARGQRELAASVGQHILRGLGAAVQGAERAGTGHGRGAYGEMLYLTGKWLRQTHLESPRTVLREFLAISVVELEQAARAARGQQAGGRSGGQVGRTTGLASHAHEPPYRAGGA
ncbi:hypothetical protein CYMTET_35585 [Cymbomonas tetramitiformis]|uniref:Uncharacterized protein n=1 Tax=Cymbomonas tetramitiformis TaxID=36881 RepID=A0AAE0F8X2_9CHLO|nr:hypothetical protein CYMTET_35585 [Cymbomonas tetramitiformis]